MKRPPDQPDVPAAVPTESQDRAADDLQTEARRHAERQVAALPLRIEMAELLDRALRLEDKLAGAQKVNHSVSLRRLLRLLSELTRPSRTKTESRSGDHDRKTERHAAVLLKSGLFDSEYYLRRNPDVATSGLEPVIHYIRSGAAELRNPGPYFSTRWYVRQYPDVLKSGKNPLYHYILHGHAEGRLPLPIGSVGDSDAEQTTCVERLVFGPIVVAKRDNTAALATHAPDPDGAIGPLARQEPATRSRLVVYTALFGDYDELFVPSAAQVKHCDFVIFTDQPNVPTVWRRGQLDFVNPDPSRRNRFYKLLPHRLFPQYEWSLYLDSNVSLRSDPIQFLDRYCNLGPAFFLFPHPNRTSVPEELAACIAGRRDDSTIMVRQVARYLDSGFRQTFPLTENNVLLRRHHQPDLVALSETWWDEVRSGSGRDQLSLPYVVEKTGYCDFALFGNDVSARTSPDFHWKSHRTRSYFAGMRDGVR